MACDEHRANSNTLAYDGLHQRSSGRARITVPFGRTFADVGEGQGLLYEDSSRNLALAINRDSAGALLALAPDDEVTLLPAEG